MEARKAMSIRKAPESMSAKDRVMAASAHAKVDQDGVA